MKLVQILISSILLILVFKVCRVCLFMKSLCLGLWRVSLKISSHLVLFVHLGLCSPRIHFCVCCEAEIHGNIRLPQHHLLDVLSSTALQYFVSIMSASASVSFWASYSNFNSMLCPTLTPPLLLLHNVLRSVRDNYHTLHPAIACVSHFFFLAFLMNLRITLSS
jgi:hypothetical protein